MEIKQLYTSCLSEAAYFIVSEGEAAVVDPLRDIENYIELAEKHNSKIKYIFETHFHADFVSGHLELAEKTGAIIVYGPTATAKFKFYLAKDNEEFEIGKIKIKVIHTPGHTLESACYLLSNESGEPYCLFTGDTLFVGEVGRPDLQSGNMSATELASILYDSLQNKIKTLPDNIIVYPGHGPGSACGKNIGKETMSTLGIQKATNYALKDMTKGDFISSVSTNLPEPPVYFSINARINKEGYEALDAVYEKGLRPFTISEFKNEASGDVWILDTRPSTVFTQGFVPGSINVGLEGRYAEWAGTVIPNGQALLLVTETGKVKESITRLARIGLDNITGYLQGGYEAWVNAGEEIDLIIDIEPDELAMDLPFDTKLEIIDVRKPEEFEDRHIKGAFNMPLNTLTDPLNVALIDDEKNIYLHCAGGYRSVIAASLLKRHGFNNIRNVLGGFNKIKDTKGIPMVRGN